MISNIVTFGDVHSPLATVDTSNAAAILGRSPRTLEDWRCTGFGPRFIKVGRGVRYRLSDLAAFLDAQTFGNTGQAMAA